MHDMLKVLLCGVGFLGYPKADHNFDNYSESHKDTLAQMSCTRGVQAPPLGVAQCFQQLRRFLTTLWG